MFNEEIFQIAVGILQLLLESTCIEVQDVKLHLSILKFHIRALALSSFLLMQLGRQQTVPQVHESLPSIWKTHTKF